MQEIIDAVARFLGVGRNAGRRIVAFGAVMLLFLSGLLAVALYFMRAMEPTRLHAVVDRILEDAPGFFAFLIGAAVALLISLTFRNVIVGLQRESKLYARQISHRVGGTTISADIGDLAVSYRTDGRGLRRTIKQLREQLAALKDEPAPTDISDPNALFQVGRQRLLDEAVRIDSISRRNLIIGILFSIIALAVLAWPLVAAFFRQMNDTQNFNVLAWAAQYYLPRFAVGLLLQFVGFFFLRLYVANELDLKHNKNEITNLEMKMMGVQLAQSFGDAISKREIMKSLAATERNFLIKKNEKTTSMEALSEYNDMKGLIEKLIDKLPGKGKNG